MVRGPQTGETGPAPLETEGEAGGGAGDTRGGDEERGRHEKCMEGEEREKSGRRRQVRWREERGAQAGKLEPGED